MHDGCFLEVLVRGREMTVVQAALEVGESSLLVDLYESQLVNGKKRADPTIRRELRCAKKARKSKLANLSLCVERYKQAVEAYNYSVAELMGDVETGPRPIAL